jgi:glycosyltransferase involved in cell wall biosynthesis
VESAGREGASLRASLGVEGAHYFLTVGTLGTKNVGAALDAIKAYRASHEKAARIVVAGALPPDVAKRVARDASLKDAVLALGHLPGGSLPALYEGAAAVVHPALYEGFGFVPLEAMRLGCPVVSSGRGALAEVCGDAAAVVPLGDPNAWADAMAALCDPSARARAVARGKARADRFRWRNTALGTLLVYRRLVGPTG